MHFAVSRHLAWIYAVGLAIGETIISSLDGWQFAPIWIGDYLVSICLLFAFFKTRDKQNVHWLVAGWACAAGFFYMDLVVNIDPAMPENLRCGPVVAWLIVLLIVAALVGFCTALSAIKAQRIQLSAAP